MINQIYIIHHVPNYDWFVLYDGKTRRLYHSRWEPFEKRTYSMFTVWNDGQISSEELIFVENSDGTYRVYRSSDEDFTTDLSDKIRSALFGQQLVKDYEAVPLSQIGYQFEDIFHVFRLPQFIDPEKEGVEQYGEKFGAAEMKRGATLPLNADEQPLLKREG